MTIEPAKLNDLSEDSRQWLENMGRLFEFEPHGEELLLSAARLLDRAQEARAAVAREGSYFTDKHGVIRAHPGVKIERDSLGLFASLTHRLRLPSEEPLVSSRPRQPRRGRR